MPIDEKITKIEKLTKDIEDEKDFDKVVEKFAQAAELIKAALGESSKGKGRVMEIIRELDGIIEKQINPEED